MVEDLVVAHAVAAAALLEQVGRIGHAFHAARDHHLAAARDQLVVREDGGFHACAAHLGERHRAGALRQTTLEARLARGCLTLACHQAVAEQHFLDQLRLDACALDSRLDGRAAQIVGGQIRKVALECAHRCARCADDDDRIVVLLAHVDLLESNGLMECGKLMRREECGDGCESYCAASCSRSLAMRECSRRSLS
ncbi:hypothetical protein SDC9_65920 [bioreactor metagenome]|uniref:Uncharacterized protein n=1 Tax=bioreactor metagenome TaxID=1076179 RepID=A0A644XZS0_9ZZZZ